MMQPSGFDSCQIVMDKFALHELVLRYCRACDRRDYRLLRSLYHDDAIDDHGKLFCGSAQEYVEWLPSMLARYEATVHSITNALFAVDGDLAEGEIYTVAYHRTHPPEPREIIIGGRYLDRYERRKGEWRFLRRWLAFDWVDERPFNAKTWARSAAASNPGRPDANDPSYRYLSLLGRADTVSSA